VSNDSHRSDKRPRKKKPGAGKVTAIPTDEGSWELREPRCAKARCEDLEEVDAMIAAGENEIAQDELRWLLSECRDFLGAHKRLGDLALAAGDARLARGHFGYAYQIGIQAIDSVGAKSLPFARLANQAFFEAGRGLVESLMKLGKRGMARNVAKRLIELDATDPLGLRELAGGSSEGPRRGKPKWRQRRKRPPGKNG
jgi:hypothetical protein